MAGLDTSDIDRLTLLYGGPLQRMLELVEERLLLAFPARKFVHQVFPARPTKAVWQAFMQRMPAVGCGFEGVGPAERNGRLFRGVARWNVFLGVKNPKARGLLMGDAAMPGLLAMMQVALAVFQGWTMPGVGAASVAAMHNGFADEWPDESLGVAQLTVDVQFTLTDERAVPRLDDFLRTAVEWPFPDVPGADALATNDLIRGENG